MTPEIIEKDLSYQIMQAAFEVHKQLGPGFLESIYEEAMWLELVKMGFQLERQKRILVTYKDQPVGEHVIDLIVEDNIILELKAVSEISALHKVQALSYLTAAGLELAIIINFGSPRVQFARVINTNHKRLFTPKVSSVNSLRKRTS
jgi:GxxExxY protein